MARYLPALISQAIRGRCREAVQGHRELIAALRRRDVDTTVRLNGAQFTDGAARLISGSTRSGMWNHENASDSASNM